MRSFRAIITASILAICLAVTACGNSGGIAGGLSVTQILSKAAAATPSAARYTFDVTTTGTSAGTLHQATAYTLNPKIIDIALSTTTSGTPSTIETIETPTTTYVNAAGQWIMTPSSGPTTDPSTLNPNKLIDLSTATGLRSVGTDQVNGNATYHLHGSVNVPTTSTTPGGSATVDVWIRQDDFYSPKRLRHMKAHPAPQPAARSP